MKFSDRQRDTVLAALRCWQRSKYACRVEGDLRDIASDHGEPLDDTEIDALCEELNHE